ncbi:arsenate reductase (glutaredoxin) [Pseudoalteromonas fenneropenaei]|uniref:Arsenate reductase n=1 Tax=Pseudoalteromonas fenneropenaei TaxID=1737459 RepID=A0ABV7CIA2_9GAMM
MSITIYHNPRCSKSRETLALLESHGHQPDIIEYLKTPPSLETLQQLLEQLGFTDAHQLLRNKEDEYKALGLSPQSSQDAILAAMVSCPKLIERPIVVHNNKAAIGRPPEAVLSLFA